MKQSNALVTVSGIPGAFTTQTGGEVSAEVSAHYDGGDKTPTQVPGRPTTSNLVVTRMYKAERDQLLVRALEKEVGKRVGRTVTVQDVDDDDIPIGKPKTYPDCTLVRVANPERDRNSSDVGMFELEFATPGAA